MNYPYPIPGSTTPSLYSVADFYFYAGSECCLGNISKTDIETVLAYLDYTQSMITNAAGSSLSGVTLTVTPQGDNAILILEQQLSHGDPNIWRFLVRGGLVGDRYNIQAVATLDDGQVWEDNISVMITDCGVSTISNSDTTLLSTFGPLIISNTLYYAATGGQTVFNLSYPDKFGHTGVLADHNVLVYEGGGRQVPYDNYTVSVGANTVTFQNPLGAGEVAVFDIVNPPPPAPVIPPPILLNSGIIATTLYYSGVQGQTVFPLGIPDEFNNVGELTANGAHVFRSGNRLTYMSDYTFDVSSNEVTFISPVGDNEPIIIELATVPPTAAVVGMIIKTEVLPITMPNIIPALSYPPNGVMMMLFVNGMAFFSIGPQAAFTVSSNMITWTSTLFSLPVGAAVIAVYTHV